MSIKYACDFCGKDTQEIVKNKEEHGVEFCNDCLKSYTSEKERVEEQHKVSLKKSLANVEKKYGVAKESLISKVLA